VSFKILLTFWFFLLGSAVGSFLNVLIYRLPREESIVFPPSHCTSCNARLKPKDLIPILSYIFLRGKCRYCGAKISWRYPMVEFVSAIFFTTVFWIYGFSFFSLKLLVLFSLCLPIFLIDLKHMIIPDVLSLGGLGIGLLISFIEGSFYDKFLGTVAFGGILLLIYILALLIFKEEGMGQGDIKLGLMLGSFLGLRLSILSLFLSYLIGGIFSILFLLFKSKNLKAALPFGPFLIIGATISIFWGDMIIRFYFSLL